MSSDDYIMVGLSIPGIILTTIGNTVFFITLMKTTSLHTPSNFLLGTLCVTDLLAGVLCQPIHIALHLSRSEQSFGPLQTVFYFAFHLSCFNSFIFSLLITLDRYAAICYPFKYGYHASCSKYLYTSFGIFLLSAIYATIEIMFYQNFKVIFWSLEVCLQLLFIILVLIIYIKIYKVVLSQRKRIAMLGNFASRRQSRISTRERSKTHTVSIIVAVFIACYTPFTVYYLMFTLTLLGKIKVHSIYKLGIWAYYLVFLNSCFNPMIYCARSQEIRRAAMRIFVPNLAHNRERHETETEENKRSRRSIQRVATSEL